MASRIVLVIHGILLWNDLSLVLGSVASVVSQIEATTDKGVSEHPESVPPMERF